MPDDSFATRPTLSPGQGVLRLLIIEDSEDDAVLLAARFRDAGYRLVTGRAWSADTLEEALATAAWDGVISDHNMPQFSALSALAILQRRGLDLPFIIVSGVIDEETAVAAMRAGASDYMSKERLDRLVPAMEREIREANNRAERRSALEAVRESEARFRALAANIPGMVFQLVRDEDGTLRFLYVSDGCTTLLGLKPVDLLAAPGVFDDMIEDADRAGLHHAMAESAQHHATVNWEGRILLGDGQSKWINLRSSPRFTETGVPVWEGIVSNITHSKSVEQELRASRGQLAELSAHLQMAKEEERERIARDIHDELGGTLVAIKIETALLSSKLPGDPLAVRKRVRAIEKLIDDAIGTASRVARELRPGILKDFGLAAAIECQAEDFSQRTGLPCHILCADHDIEPDQETSIALFRIFQEALTNVSKHAEASHVDVRLYQEGGDIVLEVIDNGRGLATEDLAKPRSFGLRGIRERVNSLGGETQFLPGGGGGTRLVVRVPLAQASADASPDAPDPNQGLLFPEAGS